MTDQTKPIDISAIEPATSYRIELARPASVAGIKLKPRGEITLRGDLLKTLIQESPNVVLCGTAIA